MFGLFDKKDKEAEVAQPDYTEVANLRIGATLKSRITDLALAREMGETLIPESDETLVVNSVHELTLDDTTIYRYQTTSGVMVEIVAPQGVRPEDSEEVVLYTLFDHITFGSDQDVEDWLGEGFGHMGQPAFSVQPDVNDDAQVSYDRLIHGGSDNWTHPIFAEVREAWGDPFDRTKPIEKSTSEHYMMLFARDIKSIKSHEQLLLDFDESAGVIKIYIGVPVDLNDLDIT